MKIYIATPVNGRKEATLEEKREKAFDRMCAIRKQLHKRFQDAEFHSSFDEHIAPINIELTNKMYGMGLPSESVIMGKCVQMVMGCDMVVLDYDWQQSKGCKLECHTAQIYGIVCEPVWLLGISREYSV